MPDKVGCSNCKGFQIDNRVFCLATVDRPWDGPLRRYKRTFQSEDLRKLFPTRALTIIDVGCGPSKFVARQIDRVIGVDHAKHPGVDVVANIAHERFPFDDRSVDMVYASHFVEHLDYEERDHVFFEVQRVLRSGGLFFFRVPHFSHYWQAAYDHKIHNYGAGTAHTIANAVWYSRGIPFFHVAGVGLNWRLRSETSAAVRLVNWLLNLSFRFSEAYLGWILGGIEEIQYLLVRAEDPAPRDL